MLYRIGHRIEKQVYRAQILYAVMDFINPAIITTIFSLKRASLLDWIFSKGWIAELLRMAGKLP